MLLLFGLVLVGCPCAAAWRVSFVGVVGRFCLAGFGVVVPSGWFAVLLAVLCVAFAVGFACGLCGGCLAVACVAAVAVGGWLCAVGRVAVGGFSLVVVAVAGLAFWAVRWLLAFGSLAVAGGFFFVLVVGEAEANFKAEADF